MSPSLSIAAILGLSVLSYQSKNVKDKIPIVKKHTSVLFTVYMEIVMLYYSFIGLFRLIKGQNKTVYGTVKTLQKFIHREGTIFRFIILFI